MTDPAARKVDAVVAILERGGRYLYGKRSPWKPVAPGYWCPISGRVEPGEAQPDAVVREVFEETGLRVRALRKVAQCDTHDGSALLHWWLVEQLDDAPARLMNDEHSELRWLTPEELRALRPVFEEDIAILLAAAAEARSPG
ncbi:MAG TPA: NUDIX domain-containing protein [Polyangiaceae bacterium]|nr:NUDIX domain-containing protein [Polyangiaceae bacterium]